MKPHFRHALEVLEYGRIREVLSSYAASALGRREALALQPVADLETLRALHAETREMAEYLAERRLPLSGLVEISSELSECAAHGRPAEPELLFKVLDLLRAGMAVRAALEKEADRFPHLARLAAACEDLPDLREEISAKLDPREGVRPEASERLRALRSEAEELRRSLRARAQAILRRPALRRAFQAEGISIKNDRYLLPVKAEYRSWVHGAVRDRSQTGATLYVEPDEILLDGDRLIDLLDAIRDEELRILWDLTRKLLAHRALLESLEARLAHVDFTYAKASYALAFGLKVPEIEREGVLELREARHPYLMWLARDARRGIREVDLEAVRRKVVPLDVRLGDPWKILIITGPNTGGKTVALKTIGLNVLLALSGVPIAAAEGSRVPRYSDIFADIGDEQSIEQNLSTFSSHLRQVVEVLRHATRRSLILLDELGSGTDPLEGAALGKALLDHFRERGWCAVITTHLGSLKEYAYLHPEAENAAMEFDPHSLRPTYRLLLGVPGSSNALAVARRLGLRKEIVERAEEEIRRASEPTRELIQSMQRSKRRVEKERRRVERVRRRVQGEARRYEERLQEIEARKEALDREADLEVERILREARGGLEPLVRQLRNVPQAHRPLVEELERRLETLLQATPLGRRREEFARSLRKHDEVYVPRFRTRGRVQKINKGERRLVVLIGGVPTELSFDDISWVEEPPPAPAR